MQTAPARRDPGPCWTPGGEFSILPCIQRSPGRAHSPQEKSALRPACRIQGQALALERAVNDGTECGALLQQLAALRGATGLMAEVLESHLRETFAQSAQAPAPTADADAEIDQIMRIVRTYLK